MSLPLADAIFWIAVACSVIAQAAIIHSVFISPARIGASSPVTLAQRITELAWAVLPAIALALVLGFTWRAMHGVPVSTIGPTT